MRHDHILQTIGRTPVIRLAQLEPPGVEIYAKLEAFNPMGSVKDRMALSVIEDAHERGLLEPGQTVVEATSGNTGIALAMVCARLGHPLVIVMAESFSVERRRLMRFLGAQVVLTPAALKGSGMLAKANELAAAHGWFLPRQFDNEANARVHERTTGPEILADFADAPLTHFVTGSGTGGTLLGIGRVLRRAWPQTQIALCEPDNSPVLASGTSTPTGDDGVPASHPAFRPHPVQGWSPDFVPGLVERARAEGLIDRIVPVSGHDALRCARELARREGVLAGISAGATLAGALSLAREAGAGSRLLVMLPDTGERYQSTPLFSDIEADMNAEEWALSRSTPFGRFDASAAPVAAVAEAAAPVTATASAHASAPAPAPAPAPVPAATAPAALTVTTAEALPTRPAESRFAVPAQVDGAEARRELAAMLDSPTQPVVMFALEWCEFCWTLRRFFPRVGAPLHCVELDAAARQADGSGARLRAALAARTGVVTLPQVFVGGRFIGGCMDTLRAWDQGHLQTLLQRAGAAFDAAAEVQTQALLPGWLQAR